MKNKKTKGKAIAILTTTIAVSALILVGVIRFKNEEIRSTITEKFFDKDNNEVSNVINHNDAQKNNTKENKNVNEPSNKNTNNTNNTNAVNTTNSSNTTNNVNSTTENNSVGTGNGNVVNGTIGQSTTGGISRNGIQTSQGSGSAGEGYGPDVGIEENSKIKEIAEEHQNNSQNEYTGEDEEDSSKSNKKEYDSWNLSVKDNEYSNISLKMNLINAPYNNDEYCKQKLTGKYTIKLVSKPEGSECTNYPEGLIETNEGNLNTKTHVYTKKGNIDFSNTTFSQLGDYYFGIFPENSEEELYQVIITLRGVTTDEGYPTGRTYSLIQIKSANGEKLSSIDINTQNPSTCITIDKKKNVNSFMERVYVDLYIDSYENDSYDVSDGNALTEIGDHYVARTEKGNIIPQTYQLSNDGKIIIGKKCTESVAMVTRIAANEGVNNLGVSSTNNGYEIPAGTRYRAEISAEKKYRESYDIDSEGEYRIASENEEENEIIITNVTGSNPKTGVFYTVAPFVIVIVLAILGIVIIKSMSSKDDE